MKSKNIIVLLIVFLFINTVVYIFTAISTKDRIDLILKEDLNKLQIHFDILNASQKNISYAIFKSIIRNSDIINILSESYTATNEQNSINRNKLYNQLKEQYETAKKQGVLQLHFVDKNNISFLRVHKPSKFGDDLTDIREDFKIVNETKKSIRGFTQGKTAHGFRNTFPIFDKNSKHIGAMEISFTSDNYQWYLNNVSQVHSHFLVDKHLFDAKTWERDDLVINYKQSSENTNLMLAINNTHTKQRCIIDNNIKLISYKQMIDENITKGEKFNFYTNYKNSIEIVSFLPIKNLSNKTVAWITSYTKSEIIKDSLTSRFMIRLSAFLISILIIYLLVRQLKASAKINEVNIKSEKQRVLFNEILNTTDNILLITDFKDIKFSNDKFKSMLLINQCSEYNKESNHNMLNKLFLHYDGYLHAGLLEENESFAHLYKNTRITDRKVLILNENFEPKAYSISIQKLISNDDFLVTLSDISKMQEEFAKIENKVYVDDLTKVYNRNKFNELLKKELKRVKRYNYPLSIAIIDIDKFKNFNDTFGHQLGDEVLISMAQTVNNSVRETDVFARWGGEEFIIMFANTSINKAKTIANTLKDKIEANTHPIAGNITASFGVTEYKEDDTIETIFKRCDEALYNAKKNGRNRVEVL